MQDKIIGTTEGDRFRSAADVVDFFARKDLAQESQLQFHVVAMELASQEIVEFVYARSFSQIARESYIVCLGAFKRFVGRRAPGDRFEEFEISALNHATVTSAGVVTLKDGTRLRAVELKSSVLQKDLPADAYRLLEYLIKITGKADVYRSLREGVEPAIAEMIPDMRALDWSRLHRLRNALPSLKAIHFGLRSEDPDWKVSMQTTANYLREFGIRVPAPRRRRSRAA